MRLRPARRLFAVLLGLWFLLVGQGPPFAHSCLMAPVSAATTDGHRTDATSEHGAHAGHLTAASEHAGHVAGHVPPADAPSHECECLGDCCCVLPVPSVPPVVVIEIATARDADASAPRAPRAERALAAPLRRQPFAIGPPSARIG